MSAAYKMVANEEATANVASARPRAVSPMLFVSHEWKTLPTVIFDLVRTSIQIHCADAKIC
jgi:hypothetical protein